MWYYSLKSRPKFTKTKKIEGHKNSLGLVIYPKYVTVAVLEETAWQTHARTYMVQIIISRPVCIFSQIESTRLCWLNTNISLDRLSLMPQAYIEFFCDAHCVIHKLL